MEASGKMASFSFEVGQIHFSESLKPERFKSSLLCPDLLNVSPSIYLSIYVYIYIYISLSFSLSLLFGVSVASRESARGPLGFF